MRARAFLAALAAAVAFAGAARADTRVDRLAKLGQLWGTVKYVHPYVWTHDVDWDGAVVRAIPKVSAAKTAAEYRAALVDLIAALGDPRTRIPGAEPDAPRLEDAGPFVRTIDGVLVVTVRAHPRADSAALAGDVAKAVKSARGIVLDVRGADTWATGFFRALGNVFSARTVTAPTTGRVFHSGFATQRGGASGGYYSALMTLAAETFPPKPDARAHRVVFLVNNASLVPNIAFALAAAGEGRIVSQGRFIPETELPVDMGEGITVSVRSAQLSPEVRVDVELPPDKDAVAAAVALAGGGKAKPVAATGMPPFRVRPDAAYAESPYPSVELRLLALYRYWNAIHYFYAYLDLIGDWDAVLPEFIPKLEAAGDALAYAQTIAELATRVPDGHSFVRSAVLRDHFGAGSPPVAVRLVEGRPTIVKVRAPGLPVTVGDVLVSVDGEPVERRAERLGRYVSASTPAAHDQMVAGRLLDGPVRTPARVTIRGADDRPREVELPRAAPAPPPDPPKDEVVKVLADNVGYVNLEYLERSDLDAAFERLKDTRAIVFDLRGYPRGVFGALATRVNRNRAQYAARFERAELDGGEPRRMQFKQEIPPSPAPVYDRPTVMLIDDRAISQSEHTGLFLEAASGTKFIGSPTAGANGDVTAVVLPGDIAVWMTGHDVRHVDGRQLQRVGLVPDVRVEPTLKGIRAGRDEVLEAALRYLAR